MESYVAKVQYRGSLRRLTLARDDEFLFSFAHFQRKTRDLFQLPVAAEIILTYVDNEGDVVTMADNDDLRDALVLQALNPLRLTMATVNNTDGKPNSPVVQQSSTGAEQTASGTSLPSESSLDSAADHSAEFPAGDPHLAAEKEAKVEDSTPKGVDLEEATPKGIDPEEATPKGFDPEEATPKGIDPEEGAADNTEAAPGDAKADNAEAAPGDAKADNAEAAPGDAKADNAEAAAGDAKADNAEAAPGGAIADGEQQGIPQQQDIHYGIQCDGCGMIPIVGPRLKSCKKANFDLCLRCFQSTSESEQSEYVRIDRRFYRLVHPAFVRWPRMMGLTHALNTRNPDEGVKDLGSDSAAGDANKTDSAAADKGLGVNPRSEVVHHGVQCDECGMTPIEGPRFKSCTRFNYDVCLVCFERSGSNAREYTRIERPAACRGYLLGLGRLMRLPSPTYRPMCGRSYWIVDQMIPKDTVDQFVVDQKTTARDAVPPAESTSNDMPVGQAEAGAGAGAGAEAIPSVSEQVDVAKIEDDALPSTSEQVVTKVEAKVEAHPLPSTLEQVEVAEVEAEADALPSPSEQVEVANVEAGAPPSASEEIEATKTEVDAPRSASEQVEATKTEVESTHSDYERQVEATTTEFVSPHSAPEPVDVTKTEVDGLSASEQVEAEVVSPVSAPEQVEVTKTEVDALSASEEVEAPTMEVDAPPSVYEQVGATEERAADIKLEIKAGDSDTRSDPEFDTLDTPVVVESPSTEESPLYNFAQSSGSEDVKASAAEGDLSTVEGLLAKLGIMGFSDEVLNREMLEKNRFDLRKTLDDLCAAEEWDPILGDLQEMGFYDANMNRRLLFKNNGSVKRVVKELVQLSKGGKTRQA